MHRCRARDSNCLGEGLVSIYDLRIKQIMMESFKLKDSEEYIHLNNLLQIMSFVASGGEAKIRIQNEEVMVNEEIETRVRKKIRSFHLLFCCQRVLFHI